MNFEPNSRHNRGHMAAMPTPILKALIWLPFPLLPEQAAWGYLLSERATQANLETVATLSKFSGLRLGDSPESIASGDALDEFVGACMRTVGQGIIVWNEPIWLW